MKIISVIGTRPEFVLVSPLDQKLRERGHQHIIVHTGQHYDYELSKAFFDQLSIPEPQYNLGIGSESHAKQTALMLIKLEEVIKHIKPDIVLVYGDTNSTLAGALASVKHHIPVGHVEAGYRSFDMSMPEEINRIITDSISQLLFAFTEGSVRNLLREGVNREKIIFSGNLKVETVLRNISKARQSTILEKIDVKPGEYALLTIHRQENADYIMRIKKIFLGLVKSPLPIIFPVHPRTKKSFLIAKKFFPLLKKLQ